MEKRLSFRRIGERPAAEEDLFDGFIGNSLDGEALHWVGSINVPSPQGKGDLEGEFIQGRAGKVEMVDH